MKAIRALLPVRHPASRSATPGAIAKFDWPIWTPARRRRLALVIAGAAVMGCVHQYPEGAPPVGTRGDWEGQITAGGLVRTYLLHVPRTNRRRRMPLVLVLHGGNGSADQIRQATEMNHEADRRGMIVAYPNGLGWFSNKEATWNAGPCCGAPALHGTDDVGFVRELIAQLGTTLPIDQRRVYATGFSDGGRMVYRLACELSDKIAAVAPVSGAIPDTTCHPSFAVSLLAVHGTADDVLRYAGGVDPDLPDGGTTLATPAAVAHWAALMRCAPEPKRRRTDPVVMDTYARCAGAGVALYTIEGTGHAWMKDPFHGTAAGPATSADSTASNWTSALILDFFARHPRSGKVSTAGPGAVGR